MKTLRKVVPSNMLRSVVILLFLTLTAEVFALKCFILSEGPQNAHSSNTFTDCRDIDSRAFIQFGKSIGDNVTVNATSDMSCYTFDYQSNGAKRERKGCMPKGGCKLIEGSEELSAWNTGGVVNNTKCTECSEDGCNFGPGGKSHRCYTTDVNQLGQFENVGNLTAAVKDCKEYLNGTGADLGAAANVEFGCFTLTADGSAAKFKGCGIKEQCLELEGYLEVKAKLTEQKWSNPKCAFCDGNECNFGSNLTVPSIFLLLLVALLNS